MNKIMIKYQKDFYRISKERIDAYLNQMQMIVNLLQEIKADNQNEVAQQHTERILELIIDMSNTLAGFRYYEDYVAGADPVDDFWINTTEFDLEKLFDIEFPKWNEIVDKRLKK